MIGTLTRSLAGSAKLKIKLTGKAKKRLKKAKSVKLSVRAVATDRRRQRRGRSPGP